MSKVGKTYWTKDKMKRAVILGEVPNGECAIDNGYKSEYLGYLDYEDGNPISWTWFDDGSCALDRELNSPECDIDFNDEFIERNEKTN